MYTPHILNCETYTTNLGDINVPTTMQGSRYADTWRHLELMRKTIVEDLQGIHRGLERCDQEDTQAKAIIRWKSRVRPEKSLPCNQADLWIAILEAVKEKTLKMQVVLEQAERTKPSSQGLKRFLPSKTNWNPVRHDAHRWYSGESVKIVAECKREVQRVEDGYAAEVKRRQEWERWQKAERERQEREILAKAERREQERKAEIERREQERQAEIERQEYERWAEIERQERERRDEIERREQEQVAKVERQRLAELQRSEFVRFTKLQKTFESQIRAGLARESELARAYHYDDLSTSSSRFRLLRVHSAREYQVLARPADTIQPYRPDTTNSVRHRYDLELFHALEEDRHRQAEFYQCYEGAIQCSMQSLDLDDADCPLFEALSYEWSANNDKGQRRLVLLDGSKVLGSLEIGYNLWSFLTHIHQPDDVFWVWADAVCINQASLQERGHQVRLMGQIYTRASKVLAWLPVNDPDSSVAQFKGLLAKRTGRRPRDHDFAVDFLGSHYWTRKWIIQEILLARTVVLVVGNHELPMQDLENRLADQQEANLAGPSASTSAVASLPIAKLAAHRRSRREARTVPEKLSELLLLYESNMCSDPFDHVYALYNLMGKHRQHLEVKYDQPASVWIAEILQFLDRYEQLSRSSMISTALTLARQNQSYDLHFLPAEERVSTVKATVFDQGALVPLEECTASIHLRKRLKSLHPGASMRFVESVDCWQILDTRQVTAQAVFSSRVLAYFELPGHELCGMAAARIHEGDHVLRFVDTTFGFIARFEPRSKASSSRTLQILGRCYLFDTSGNEPTSNTFSSNSVEKKGKSLQSYDLELNISSLFHLAYAAANEAFPPTTSSVETASVYTFSEGAKVLRSSSSSSISE